MSTYADTIAMNLAVRAQSILHGDVADPSNLPPEQAQTVIDWHQAQLHRQLVYEQRTPGWFFFHKRITKAQAKAMFEPHPTPRTSDDA